MSSDCPHAAKANPIAYVTKDAPPFLICHGDQDPLVPHHQSELLEAALKKAGIPVTLYTVHGAGHGRFNDPRVPEMTREFLAKHLKPSISTRAQDAEEGFTPLFDGATLTGWTINCLPKDRELAAKGVIGLQVHANDELRLRFKDIRIREM